MPVWEGVVFGKGTRLHVPSKIHQLMFAQELRGVQRLERLQLLPLPGQWDQPGKGQPSLPPQPSPASPT
ncbi:unnamed protein product [Bubo scandiacus]